METTRTLKLADKQSKLICRLENNYDDFLQYLSGVSRQTLINMASHIVAYSEIYIYFTKEHEWEGEYDIDFFLLFKNPLAIMVDTWMDFRDRMTFDGGGIMSCLNRNKSAITEYPLAEGADLQLCGEFRFGGKGGVG